MITEAPTRRSSRAGSLPNSNFPRDYKELLR